MLIKTSELTGPALDWAVAKCEGKDGDCEIHAGNVLYGRVTSGFVQCRPSTDWSQGGPIIERELIRVIAPTIRGVYWVARIKQELLPALNGWFEKTGPTPLIAAMRCFCASKLGDEVDIPAELLG